MMSITEPALRDDSECLCFETTVQLSGQASCDLKVNICIKSININTSINMCHSAHDHCAYCSAILYFFKRKFL
jgi:hypothetical protein